MGTLKVFTILPILISLLGLALGGQNHHHGNQQPLRLSSSAFAIPGVDATYDYVIVGGGMAGLTLAARLAPTASVAVVEAGGVYQIDNGNQSTVPYYAFSLPFADQTQEYPRHPLMDWDIVSIPQPGAAGRKIHYPQGKTLGGSSAIHSLAYQRASKGTYSRWAEMVEDDSFLWDNVLPYFLKSATMNPPDLDKRGQPEAVVEYEDTMFGDGPLQVGFSNYVDETALSLSLALQNQGMPRGPTGFTSGFVSGFSAWAASTITSDSKRSSSANSYLKQAIQETDVMVYQQTQAMKIMLDSSNSLPVATGVQVSTRGLEYTLSASKEVIVSAGSFFSPQLLMVSGIGPEEVLSEHGIPVVVDLPQVGQNLQDQPHFDVLHGMSTSTAAGMIGSNPEEALGAYLSTDAGPYAYAGGFLGFEKLPSSIRQGLSNATLAYLDEFDEDWPEVEYIVAGFPGGPNSTVGFVTGILQTPASRGNITLSGPSMAHSPVVDLGWLTDQVDQEVAVAAVRRCRDVFGAEEVADLIVGDEIAPGAAATSDEDLLAYVRGAATTIYHVSSTCAMGKDAHSGVVDTKGKVFGVNALRVVDASILPFLMPGHPQGTIYMLAEKIADNILVDN